MLFTELRSVRVENGSVKGEKMKKLLDWLNLMQM